MPTILHDQPGPKLASSIPCNRQLTGFLLRTAIDRNGVESGHFLDLRLSSRHAFGMRTQKTLKMYIEDKSGGLNGPARIGRVTFCKSGRSLHYGDRTFQTLSGTGFKANYFDVDTGDQFWISGPRKHGRDRLAEWAGGFARSRHAADANQPILTGGAFALTEPSEEYQAQFYRQTLAMAERVPTLRGMSP